MAEKKQPGISSWLIWGPLKFAMISFALMLIAALGYGMANSLIFDGNASRITLHVLLGVAFAAAVVLAIYKMPRSNLDRRSFVAVCNAQTFTVSATFIISTLLIVANAQKIMLHMLRLESHSPTMFVIVMIIAALFYLFLCGLFIANIYAKYRRCRAMGISAWKTICTLPFGYALLWIPGYLIADEKAKKDATVAIRAKWYAKLTDWIISKPVITVIVFVALGVFSGFFFGFNAILLTMFLGIVFAIWSNIQGTKKFRKNIGGKYTTFAIAANIVLLIAFITLVALKTAPQIADVYMDTREIGAVMQPETLR